MNKKELILKTREFFRKQNSSKELVQNSEVDISKYDIDLKYLEFVNWCKEKFPNFKESDVLSFIEKMAIWYEFRYPNQIINTLFNNDNKNSFQELNDLINWKDLFDFDTFIVILSQEEKELLEEPRFKSYYKLERDGLVYFGPDGKILKIDFSKSRLDRFNINKVLKNLIGQDAKELVSVLMEYSRFEDALNIQDLSLEYSNKLLFKEKLINMVLYKIIKRGNPELGFLFALEFNLDISISLTYIKRNSSFNSLLLYEYLKLGGNLDLTTYQDKSLTKESKILGICNEVKVLTDEEKALQENIINLLNLKEIFKKDESYQKVLKKTNLSI